MAIHDWTRVDAGIFHHFHHGWIEEISRVLNRGLLPRDYYALAGQITGNLGPDVLTLYASRPAAIQPNFPADGRSNEGVALADVPPRVRFHATIAETDAYAASSRRTYTSPSH